MYAIRSYYENLDLTTKSLVGEHIENRLLAKDDRFGDGVAVDVEAQQVGAA